MTADPRSGGTPAARLAPLLRACASVEELTDISGKVKSSRPDSATDVLILSLGNLRALIAAPDVVRALGAEVSSLREAAQRALVELESVEWQGCDPSAMPECVSCRREPPDYDRRATSDPTETHNADCSWLAAVLALRGALAPASREPTTEQEKSV